MSERLSRRRFLKTAGAVVAAAAAARSLGAEGKIAIPQRVLGKTGVKVPALGLGIAQVGYRVEKDAVAHLHRCLDLGLTYVDTAPAFMGYGRSQAYLGQVLQERRKEVFLVTKCCEPDGEKARRMLEASLKELQTDHADLVYAHAVGADAMSPDRLLAPTGVCKALEKARQDGLTRFVGISSHNRTSWCLKMIKEWDFDVMMNAAGIAAQHTYKFREKVWPEAARKGIGLVAMKVYGGGVGTGKGSRLPDALKPAAFRYALGLPEPAVVVIGMFDRDEVDQNLGWMATHKPLAPEELKDLEAAVRPYAEKWGFVYGPEE